MRKRFGRFAVASALAMWGCGGSSASESQQSAGNGAGGEIAGETEGFDMEGFERAEPTVDHGTQSARQLLGVRPPPTPFDRMSHDEQVYWMVSNVLPIAAEDFRSYDPERFATFTCEGCHGDDARAVNYEMPSARLPRLPARGTPDWARMEQGRAYRFMNDVVTPTMATLLGEELWSPQHTDGFDCFDCHTRRQ